MTDTDPDMPPVWLEAATPREKVRALRRARRYLATSNGALARILRVYADRVAHHPEQAIWPEQ